MDINYACIENSETNYVII